MVEIYRACPCCKRTLFAIQIGQAVCSDCAEQDGCADIEQDACALQARARKWAIALSDAEEYLLGAGASEQAEHSAEHSAGASEQSPRRAARRIWTGLRRLARRA